MKTAPDHSRAVVDALSPRLRALAPRQHVEEVDDVLIFGEDAVVVEVDRARHRSGDERAIEHAARAGADGVFAAEEIVFDRAKRVFAAEEIVFARVKTVLAAAKCLPAGAKCLPAAEKTAPAAEESLPAAEKTAPAAGAPAPAARAPAETPGATAHARALSLALAGVVSRPSGRCLSPQRALSLAPAGGGLHPLIRQCNLPGTFVPPTREHGGTAGGTT